MGSSGAVCGLTECIIIRYARVGALQVFLSSLGVVGRRNGVLNLLFVSTPLRLAYYSGLVIEGSVGVQTHV